MDEAVDTSYVKYRDAIDDHPSNLVKPEEGQLYVGWTAPGEWFNITVDVVRSGRYSIDLLYTSHQGGSIGITVNGEDATGAVNIVSTFNTADPIEWRQWHHWNIMKDIATVDLIVGINVLTIHILTEGNLNLAYFQFNEVEQLK